jgi:hypothetical protein
MPGEGGAARAPQVRAGSELGGYEVAPQVFTEVRELVGLRSYR